MYTTRTRACKSIVQTGLTVFPKHENGRLGLTKTTDGLLSHSKTERFQARIDLWFCRFVRIAGLSREMISRRAICTLQCFLQLL